MRALGRLRALQYASQRKIASLACHIVENGLWYVVSRLSRARAWTSARVLEGTWVVSPTFAIYTSGPANASIATAARCGSGL
ncbi:hypothetical protein CW362_31185 [Streptomyces populi]|uniref:Uncharacterized protein n=1 Tax=Streptomyces populi TaxID=2058924 RepID=A0A2I0SGS0_9ACTN|nr:hypothetical protein CW362_31185 [Streptomyces populi]